METQHTQVDAHECASCGSNIHKLHENGIDFPYQCVSCHQALCEDCIIELTVGKYNSMGNEINDPRCTKVLGYKGHIFICMECVYHKEITFIESTPVEKLPLWINYPWETSGASEYFKGILSNPRKRYAYT